MENQPGEGEDQKKDQEPFDKSEIEFADFIAKLIADLTIGQVANARLKRYQDKPDNPMPPDQEDA